MSRRVFSTKPPMQVVVIGGSFTNKGAEAMVLTSVEQVARRFPGARVTVASYVKNESLSYGTHRNLQGIEATFDYVKNGRQWTKPLRIGLLGTPLPSHLKTLVVGGDAYLRALAEADVVLDVSGFAMSDQRPLLRQLVYCFDIASCRWLGVPFVALTQAFGPFSGITRPLARAFLPLADLLIARGQASAEHLRGLGLSTFRTCSDIAYLFRGYDADAGRELLRTQGVPDQALTFGLVPNINLYARSAGLGTNNTYIRGLVRLAQLATELSATPVFLCHESYPDRQDDAWIAREVVQAAGLDAAVIVQADHSAAELKAMLRALDFVVACRFHAVVAAISTATPFLALGWSHKYQELVEEAGEDFAILDGRRTTPEAWCEQARTLWGARDAMRTRLGRRVAKLKVSSARAFDAVEDLLSEGVVGDSDRSPALRSADARAVH